MGEWIKDRNPDKDGEYLCITGIKGFYFRQILHFASDLYQIDQYAFELCKNKNQSGWYDYDSKWGGYNLKKVFAWSELPETLEEFKKMISDLSYYEVIEKNEDNN